jgi:hypothetical protein
MIPFRVPEDFQDIDKISNELTKFNPSLHIEELMFIIQYLYECPHHKRKDNHYVPLNFKTLRDKYGIRQVKAYKRFLVLKEMATPDNHYVPGKESSGMLLNYTKHAEKIIKLPSKKKNLLKYVTNKRTNKAIADKHVPHLTKFFNDNLQMDIEKARQLLYDYFKTISKDEARNKAPSYFYKLNEFQRDEYLYNYDFKGGWRFYSILTNMSRKLREFVHYDGKSFVNVDISNSQPFCLLSLFQEEFYTTEKPARLGIMDAAANGDVNINYLNLKQYILGDNLGSDFDLFKMLLVNGGLYEYMSKKFFKKFPDDCKVVSNIKKHNKHRDIGFSFSRRENIKQFMLLIMYSSNKFNNEAISYFNNLFPSVGEFLKIAKKNRNKKDFPVALQRIESEMVINNACNKITLTHTEIPIFTLHDSIITTEGHENTVKKILNDEIVKYIGLEPNLKIEKWCKKQENN